MIMHDPLGHGPLLDHPARAPTDRFNVAEAAAKAAIGNLNTAHRQEVQELRDRVANLTDCLHKLKAAEAMTTFDIDDQLVAMKQAKLALEGPPVHEHGLNGTKGLAEVTPLNGTNLVIPTKECPCRPSTSSTGIRRSVCPIPPQVRREGPRDEEAAKQRKSESIAKQAERIIRECTKYWTPARKRRTPTRLRRTSNNGQTELNMQTIIEHPFFDFVCAVMIITNSVLVGIDVQWKVDNDSHNRVVYALSHFCSAFFLFELISRMWCYRSGFWVNENNGWNIFDFCLVIFSVVDVVMDAANASSSASSVGTGLKTIKMLRIVRVFRVFRFSRELSLLALMIVDSMKSLMWALLMLSIIVYVFAVCFTQQATEYVKAKAELQVAPKVLPEVERQFGTLGKTVYSLIQAMLGGVSWGVVSDVLLEINSVLLALFFFYIFFTILAVLNIITGVFVDNAVETAKTQRDFLVAKEMELKEKYLGEMKQLFTEMDEDNSGTVSIQEIEKYFADPRVQSYFVALGLDTHDISRLFKLMDENDTGDVDMDEFLSGCIRFKGVARSIDVHHLILETRRVEKKIDELMNKKAEDPPPPPVGSL